MSRSHQLRASEAEAALRLRAAKLGRAFPIALEMLGRSELNLTTLSLLAPVRTPDTLGLLHQARFKSKTQVLELIANHAPKPDVPDAIRRSPRPSARAPHAEASPHAAGSPRPMSPPSEPLLSTPNDPLLSTPPAARPAPSTVVPLSSERHKITFETMKFPSN